MAVCGRPNRAARVESPHMDVTSFVAKWRASTLKESAAYVSHFEDLCRLVGHETPTDADPSGSFFTYQRAVAKQGGKLGFADVWYRNRFGLEYKGKHENLDKAYGQLLLYRDNLENPPLLITCDLERIEIHTNFTGFVSKTYVIGLGDLTSGKKLPGSDFTAMDILRLCFYEPTRLKPLQTRVELTKERVVMFAALSASLRSTYSDERVARFLTRLVFCMFASDIGLLPKHVLSSIARRESQKAGSGEQLLATLFARMASGGDFGTDEIPYFDGDLFADADVLTIPGNNWDRIRLADRASWADIEPSIFGTLFERILNPDKRSQLGAHYTSRTDIDVLVEPVLMWPLQREWKALKDELAPLVDWSEKATQVRSPMRFELESKLAAFLDRLASVTVLDPACGSGNFLYVSLAWLKSMEKEVIAFGADAGITNLVPKVHPRQLYGIEVDPYAHELASIVVWIGYLQWKHANGIALTTEIPILEPLTNIHHMDAILDRSDPAHPREPRWPETDVIVGNPPFLGGKRLRTELGDAYVDALFAVWDGRVRRESDLCCYWFEKGRSVIEAAKTDRAGLLATQSIHKGSNSAVLRKIKQTGDIFFAEANREWTLDGAAVRVSMVGFDNGDELLRVRDGQQVSAINADLTRGLDLTTAQRLKENLGISFMGDTKVGPFEISAQQAEQMLAAPNPHGKPNSDVVRPWVNGKDITARRRDMWIVDFPPGTSEVDAALYEEPFERIKADVRPFRSTARSGDATGVKWWIHQRPRPDMRAAIDGRSRFLVTPRVAKHRLFAWLRPPCLPDVRLFVFARDDDYFFGVLHSRAHESWALAKGSRHGDGADGGRPTYNNTDCFETFPLPWPPGQEPMGTPVVEAIAEAARDLNQLRENWLNPPQGSISDAQLKKRTLTNLYNQRPTWLDIAHRKLDEAVFAAYGWPEAPDTVSDQEILARLLALNLAR